MFKIVNVQIDPILLETHFRKLATKDSNPPTYQKSFWIENQFWYGLFVYTYSQIKVIPKILQQNQNLSEKVG